MALALALAGHTHPCSPLLAIQPPHFSTQTTVSHTTQAVEEDARFEKKQKNSKNCTWFGFLSFVK